MEKILPVSDLRSYNQTLSDVKPGNEVILTKNGHAKYVVSDFDEFQRMKATLELFGEIQKGIQSISNEKTLSIDELRNRKRVYKNDL